MASKQYEPILAGDFHVAAVTNFGELYTWGLSMHGALGLTDNIPSAVKTPFLVRVCPRSALLDLCSAWLSGPLDAVA